jgi:superfamily II DNA or RNA helicase
MKLEDIHPGLFLEGLVPGEVAQIKYVEPVGPDSLTVGFKVAGKPVQEQLLYRDAEAFLSPATVKLPWSFTSPGAQFKLALEAHRMKLGHLFDPMMAVHASSIEPLPHQIAAVYESMLPRQPLRFVLADDPGAGKTVMAGLLVKELALRGDAHRILIVAPGSLVEQWQDELRDKFGLDFELFSVEAQAQSASGNFFAEHDRVIARIDQLARSDEHRSRLSAVEWDLVIVDEAHKMAVHRYGNEVKKTQRFELGELLQSRTRHLLLMTATPHSGKEDDFRLWLTLLDSDRFAGTHGANGKTDASDVMRRLVKEELVRFDGTPLFPKRHAHTISYELSQSERALYEAVTSYVKHEMNRADALGDKQQTGRVGLALTVLQRRLASSPEAIYQSLRRRRERLEAELERARAAIPRSPQPIRDTAENSPGAASGTPSAFAYGIPPPSLPKFGDFTDFDDLSDELTGEEFEQVIDQVADASTASRTPDELRREIETLRKLEKQAADNVASGDDRKWRALSEAIQTENDMRDSVTGSPRKLIVFTEHKDTLRYLEARIGSLLGRPDAVRTISGSTRREDRRRIQEEFRNDPSVLVLVATDAAGEGVNLQNANLMVNYDLPWNPNRIEQRFGRIHRIGQTLPCHLWNLVARGTREGYVFTALFTKLEAESEALGGRVFDILGDAFEEVPLKNLLIKAIREGESPEARDWMKQKVESALDTGHLREIISRQSLVPDVLSPEALYRVKAEMERAEARKLQPCFVGAFLRQALGSLGGETRRREPGRWEIPHVPEIVRKNDPVLGLSRFPVLRRYERICFDRESIRPTPASQPAEFVHPGHPLMLSLVDRILEKHGSLLAAGSVLLDPTDESLVPSLLFLVDHSLRLASSDTSGHRVVSRRLQFVRMRPDGAFSNAGWAPHLDLKETTDGLKPLAEAILKQTWLSGDIQSRALAWATDNLAREHFETVRARRSDQIDRLKTAVRSRLVSEIGWYQSDGARFRERNDRLNAEKAFRTAEELAERLRSREAELERERQLVSCAPSVLGAILVIPQGLAKAGVASLPSVFSADALARSRIELAAMKAVMDAEKALGFDPIDVSAEKCGWDISSGTPKHPRHIEVKGRAYGADTVTVTRNEVCSAVNQGGKFILAICLVRPDGTCEGPHCIPSPFDREPSDNVESENYSISGLLARARTPAETVELETDNELP